MFEQLEILRRIAERGLKQARHEEFNRSRTVDSWQHMLDEIERAYIMAQEAYYGAR